MCSCLSYVCICVYRERELIKLKNFMSKMTQVIEDYLKKKHEVSVKKCQRLVYDNW